MAGTVVKATSYAYNAGKTLRVTRQMPSLAERLLELVMAREPLGDSIVGDLAEERVAVRRRRGPLVATLWHWRQAVPLVVRFGWRRIAHPRTRAKRRKPVMDGLIRDLRQSLRALARQPAFSLIVALTLAVGLAANVSILAVVDALILRPLTLADHERIVRVFGHAPSGVFADRSSVAPADFLDFRRETRAAERLEALAFWDASVTGTTEPERVQGFRVTPGFFALMGVSPAMGRAFTTAEGEPGHDRVVVLGHGLWNRRFAGNPAIVGQTIRIDGESHTVIGVAPPAFDFPIGCEVWKPLTFSPDYAANRTSHMLAVLGRLAPGRTAADVQAELATVARRLAQQLPQSNRGWSVNVMSLAKSVQDIGVGPFLMVWQASAIFILLIACANVTNLLLVRGAARQKSVTLSAALGASRWRMMRQLLVETLLLALVGAVLALPLVWLGLHALTSAMPAEVARFIGGWDQMDIDGRALAMAFALAVVATLVAGLVPAWRASSVSLSDALKEGGRASGGAGRSRLRNALVVAEVALALTLLVAAGLSVQGMIRVITQDDGYDQDGVLTMRMNLPASRYGEPTPRRLFHEALVARTAALAGVEQSGVINILPSSGNNSSRTIEIDGRPVADESQRLRPDYRTVTPDALRVLRIPILQGRGIGATDGADSARVAVVNRAMADAYWPGESVIGRRFRMRDGDWLTIVGVAGSVRHDWFINRFEPTFYVPIAQDPSGELALVLRARGEPTRLAGDARAAVRSLDPDLPVYSVRSLNRVRYDRAVGLRFAAGQMGTFGLVGLLLAAVGVYGVMAYTVTLRTHEIGVRMALGASRRGVLLDTIGRALWLTGLGLAFGLAGAYALGRTMEQVLFGSVKLDAASFAWLSVLLAAVATAASIFPAYRATRVDPVVALRGE
jgi:putative ABC transport system permease protein